MYFFYLPLGGGGVRWLFCLIFLFTLRWWWSSMAWGQLGRCWCRKAWSSFQTPRMVCFRMPTSHLPSLGSTSGSSKWSAVSTCTRSGQWTGARYGTWTGFTAAFLQLSVITLLIISHNTNKVRNMDWIYRNIPGAKVERRTHQSLNVPEIPGQSVYQTLIGDNPFFFL